MTLSAGGRGGGRLALLAAARAELAEHGHASIGLRAVARRAGMSHAAPTYHFGDRSGLLTAVAAEGFRELAAALRAVVDGGRRPDLAELGGAYIDFGLAHPALFDLMFRPAELVLDDPELTAAETEALSILGSVVQGTAGSAPSGSAPSAGTAGAAGTAASAGAAGTAVSDPSAGAVESLGSPAAPRGADGAAGDRTPPPLALVSWAVVHGLVVLVRDGALQNAVGGDPAPAAAAELAHRLARLGAERLLSRPVHRSRP
ncbi:TetR/AcrR family transcriptional regulator [Nakamurella endophytica]|uniref:HTH tetR-type domain-containing protein n=1 Tax=Nakamurella endophytica TaxID=1748367 RepID=A0A917WMM0_9ACTN|nr:TetR/AcrR family transcriptional regulator [Nakamurella endophytica]GGM16762.1 hypothetical protein GCM10011594_41030 [Nakamurella endophytica]